MFRQLKKLLFESRKPSVPAVRDLLSLTKHLMQPAIQLRTSEKVGRSYFGGAPHLPADFDWPQRNGKKLAFVARISLADLAKAHRITWLPNQGALVFFYDVQEQPWGFDPSDRGGWAVVMVPDITAKMAAKQESLVTEDAHSLVKSQNKTAAPKTFLWGILSFGKSQSMAAHDLAQPINFVPLALHKIALLPDVESGTVQALALSTVEWEAYNDLRTLAFDDHAAHQISGPPSPIQGEMELECQLASHGIQCGKTDPSQNKRAKALEKGARNWRLLLQIEDDDELGIMFGDAGTLYFWVEETRAKKGDFSNVWVILQCS